MKCLLLLLFLALTTPNQSGKIEFIDNDWQKASLQAKQTNKYLLVDCYTDACYWCKVMDQKTFTNDTVAVAMSKNFVSVKMNMEQGLGKLVAMKFKVLSYPTYLIFNTDGKLVYRVKGYKDASGFLERLDMSLHPTNQQIAPGISNKLDLGFPDFYKQTFSGIPRKTPDSLILNTYLDQQPNLMSEVNFDILYLYAENLRAKYKQYILKNKSKYAALYTQQAVDELTASFGDDSENLH